MSLIEPNEEKEKPEQRLALLNRNESKEEETTQKLSNSPHIPWRDNQLNNNKLGAIKPNHQKEEPKFKERAISFAQKVSTLLKTELSENKERFIINNNPLISNKLTVLSIALLRPDLLHRDSLIEPMNTRELIVKTPNKFKASFELGILGTVRSSIWVNDLHFKSLTAASTPYKEKHIISFSGGYGLAAKYRFAPRHSLSAHFWLNSQSRQYYEFEHKGKTGSVSVESNFIKLNILYQFQLLQYGAKKQNQLHLGFGAYAAYLRSYSTLYQQKPLSLKEPEIGNTDGGLTLGISQEHRLHRLLSLEYGLQCDMGLANILKNKQQGSQLFGFDAFIALRYRF